MFNTPENLLVWISGALGTKESHYLSKNVIWENAVEYFINSECQSFQTFLAIVFSTPENLIVVISRDLGTKESHYLSKNVFWENAVGVSHKQWMLEFSNLCHCVQHPWKLTGRDFWSSRNKRKPLSNQKCILRKWGGVSHKQWMLELSNLCHCIQHLWKLTCRDFWSSRNKRKPLSKQKCILRKWGGVSHKQWMLELSNLCHCIQHLVKTYL